MWNKRQNSSAGKPQMCLLGNGRERKTTKLESGQCKKTRDKNS